MKARLRGIDIACQARRQEDDQRHIGLDRPLRGHALVEGRNQRVEAKEDQAGPEQKAFGLVAGPSRLIGLDRAGDHTGEKNWRAQPRLDRDIDQRPGQAEAPSLLAKQVIADRRRMRGQAIEHRGREPRGRQGLRPARIQVRARRRRGRPGCSARSRARPVHGRGETIVDEEAQARAESGQRPPDQPLRSAAVADHCA